ncbi:hypothetical protein SYNPS1DRAFT_26988 [Syncephalis pseudoplumigaleata]|uniref:Lung seven transmembrane receptor-domain-containing protein n=1 Tax=Syncephalis pseudoplumigaleata TaxID=1712513 RepID=A0A4P9Z469_9FUNG|nr:hypothetical protein SYNPS1DRAFT_26988 [Syncephalis pseudoplumigaleata]|eukprot:RKP27357.1 hypothetical protein SYNPS1DRAFT_26988 [Syncephalis pseudoplumigaleata]
MLAGILLRTYLFVLLATCGLLRGARAKIVIYDEGWNASTAIVSATYDHYRVDMPYYDWKGYLLYLPFDRTAANCTFLRPKNNSTRVREYAANASSYEQFAFMINWALATTHKCGTVERVMQMAMTESEAWQTYNFPPVDLLVFYTNKQDGRAEYWGSTFDGWGKPSERRSIQGVASTFMSREGALEFGERYGSGVSPFQLRFHATQERGPWNDAIFSPGTVAKEWIFFVLSAICLIYALIRFAWLVHLGGVRRDLRLAIMIIALISTTLFCISRFIGEEARNVVKLVTQFLAILAFELLLWHWSIRGKTIFPRKSVVGFRILIVIHLLLELVVFLFNILRIGFAIDGVLQNHRKAFTAVVSPIATFSGVLIFGGFGVWFFICTYRVRRHSQARWRFVQLSIFSLLAALTFIMEASITFVGGYGTVNSNNTRASEIEYINVITVVVCFIRSVVCLGVWGVSWPRRGENFNSPVSTNQQSNKGKDTRDNNNSNSNSNNNNANNNNNNSSSNNATEDSRQEKRWSTFGWVRLASALGHNRDSQHGSASNNSSKLRVDPRRMNLLEENSICEEDSMVVEAMGETIDIKTVFVNGKEESEQ